MKSISEPTCIYTVKPCDVIYFFGQGFGFDVFLEQGAARVCLKVGKGPIQTKRHKIKESLETRVSQNLVKLRTRILNDGWTPLVK